MLAKQFTTDSEEWRMGSKNSKRVIDPMSINGAVKSERRDMITFNVDGTGANEIKEADEAKGKALIYGKEDLDGWCWIAQKDDDDMVDYVGKDRRRFLSGGIIRSI
ncbi:hypothetical protein Ancab_004653 [Ancistrocladus abbreviatus]